MSAITVTAAQVAILYPPYAEIYSYEAAEAIAAGQTVYINSNGKAALGDASNAETLVMAGLAIENKGAGGAVSVLKQGYVVGATLTGLAYGDPVYASDTAGGLDTAAGTVSKVLGRVAPINEAGNIQKALYIQSDWN